MKRRKKGNPKPASAAANTDKKEFELMEVKPRAGSGV